MFAHLKKQVFISGCLYLGQIVVGYGTGWTAPVIPKFQDPDQTPLEDVLTPGQSSWVGSFAFLGCIIGPYITGYLSNVIGRKPCLFLGGGVTLVGFALMALAKHIAMIYAGRAVVGLGTGIIFVMNLVYIGEMASTHIRGILLTLTGFFQTFGTLVIYVVGPFVSYSTTGWLAVAMTTAYLIGIIFIPETPVYQLMVGDTEKAIANLKSLGRKDDIDNNLAIKTKEPKSTISQMTEMLNVKTNRKALSIIVVLNILQQMSGVMAIIFFSTSIFDLTGLSMESHIATIIVGVTQIFAGLITPFFIERAGRKFLLLLSTAGCSLSLAALGSYFYLYNTSHPAAEKVPWLSLLSLIMFLIFYGLGFGIIPNTFIGEMFTSNVRSFGSAFTVTIGWLFGFGVSTAFGYMVPAWGAHVTFWVYSSACAAAFFFSLVFVPETKGKSLLEIQDMLSK